MPSTVRECWEQRWHPLREEWVIIAAHRNDRPWDGHHVDEPTIDDLVAFDPGCPLCPGNRRVSGIRNDRYEGIYVFDNDLPCVGDQADRELAEAPSFYRNQPAQGVARVVCYTPRHDTSLAELGLDEIVHLLECWQQQYQELGARSEVQHVLIFENRGEVVGVSNPHPHCQIYATNFVFKTIANESEICHRYWREQRRVLFSDIIAAEREDGRRLLFENDAAISFVPYFARYAYETYVAPKETYASIADVSDTELRCLADALQDTLIRYDNLWQMPFPYVLALHQAPTDGRPHDGFHFHLEFHPPLRRPGMLKHLAGPEIGGGSFLSDTCPEAKAAELQAQPTRHYKRVFPQ